MCYNYIMTIDKTKRVYVYWNLHKKCWSIRQSGKIVEHSHDVCLKDCRFLVGEAGRQRVLREKRKNVHAGISGYVVSRLRMAEAMRWDDGLMNYVSYNPYKFKTFVTCWPKYEPVCGADYSRLYIDEIATVFAIGLRFDELSTRHGTTQTVQSQKRTSRMDAP